MTETLAFTALTSSGLAYDIDFPLHPGTRSADGVSGLLTALLDCLSQQLDGRHPVSDGDVLQALTMTLAIRARMTGPDAEATERLVVDLFREAHAAARTARSYAMGRA
ncbi:hypothetical protein F8A87_07445 [Betaproteobacteria bacterium SCN2]|jgi:hypothetical protein|nr:hypothetical protein F8A87_07445 [Betaproteobacteria bacterium SCN2]